MSNTEPRKTAKYYREILNGNDIRKAVSVLPEVIKKFGSKRWATSKHNDQIYIRSYTEFEWNHQIEKFGINDKGIVYADIYWQGDSTDGNTSEYANNLINGRVIPAEWDNIGGSYGMVQRHGLLRITREEFTNALKAVAKYLSPEEIKKRKIANAREETDTKVFNYIDAKKKSLDRWEMENFWNGRIAVQKVLEKNPELLDKSFDVLKPIVEKVYSNNEKSDYSLRGGWYNGEKKYNLAY